MPRVDTKNAHVREPKRDEKSKAPTQETLDADRLFNDPAFVRSMTMMERGIVDLIVNTPHDGSPEADAAEREMCRSLRTLKRLPTVMTKLLQGQQLRLADFRAHAPNEEG